MAMTISDTELAVLKAARAVLREVQARCLEESHDVNDTDGYTNTRYNLGKLGEACDHAEETVFNVLNTAKSYLNIEVGEF
jgi:hypothetical protein